MRRRQRISDVFCGYEDRRNQNYNNRPVETTSKGVFKDCKDWLVNHKGKTTFVATLVTSGVAWLSWGIYSKKKHIKDQQKVDSKARKQENGVDERNDEKRINVSLIKPGEHVVDNLPDKWEVVPEEEKELLSKLLDSEFAVGEKVAVNMYLNYRTISGTLQCDIQSDLIKVKGNPAAMRGFSKKGGTIKHGEFTEVGVGRISASLIWEFMTAITFQHDLDKLSEKLDHINIKLDQSANEHKNGDLAKLKEACRKFNENCRRKSYTSYDLEKMHDLYDEVRNVKDKYDGILADIDIEDLRVEVSGTEFNAAQKKIAILDESKYFCYLRMAIIADFCCYITNHLVWQIAESLGDEEIVRICSERLVTPWGGHKEQFLRFKHDVLGFVELKCESANYFSKKEIKNKFDEQQSKFDKMEKWIDKIYQMTIYYRYDEDGNLRRGIPAE